MTYFVDSVLTDKFATPLRKRFMKVPDLQQHRSETFLSFLQSGVANLPVMVEATKYVIYPFGVLFLEALMNEISRFHHLFVYVWKTSIDSKYPTEAT